MRDPFVRGMVLLNLVALVAANLSGQWDAAMHARGEVDTFWYPPHYGIYFALGTAAFVAIAGLGVALRGPGDVLDKVRRHAALVAIAGANGIGFAGAPFDAWWHERYGIDLSVWSPPHLHLLFGLVLAAMVAAVFFLDAGPAGREFRSPRALLGSEGLAGAALVVGLLLASFLFFEYEAGLANSEVLARAVWTYPVLWTGFAVFAVALSASTLRMRFGATIVAASYVAARLAILGLDRAVLGFGGAVPYPLVVPALAFDLAVQVPIPRLTRRARVFLAGTAAAAVTIATAPAFWSWAGVLPTLTVEPWARAWPAALLAGTLGSSLGWAGGFLLRRLRPREETRQTPAAVPE